MQFNSSQHARTWCQQLTGMRSPMKWLSSTVVMLMLFAFLLPPNTTQAQIVAGAAVKANVGIDADVYANRLQFGGLSGASGTDDWFLNTSLWPGTGLNIIDQTNAAARRAAVLANNNFAFEERQSVPFNTIVNGRIWLDAVYGRDNNAIGNNIDATTFAGSSNKNGDNPSTWSLGPGGTPPKNDIVDVWGHLRRDGTTASSNLWGFGGATTMSADGNSHNDFEFFRAPFTYNGSAFIGTGPNAGHTAWQFDATGNILVPGDVLVAVDFENGGTTPKASIRVWISQTDFNTLNSKPNRPFRITSEFDQGNDAGVYGYASIDTKDPSAPAAVFAVVNTTASTLGAPWGSLEGNATFFDDIKELQFSEFGINLTALGLDRRNANQAPCSNILGTLIVKTRSSSSFTAELKDFSGPYQFGNFTEVSVTAHASNVLTCSNPTATLTASNILPVGATITWYGPSPGPGDPGPALVGTSPVVSVQGVYTVRATTTLAGCFAESTVTVTENKTPPNANAGADKVLNCSILSIALSGSSSTAGATFAWVASNGGNIVSGANTATPIVNAAGTYTLTVTNPANGCTATDVALVTLNNTPPNANAGLDKVLTCSTTSIALSGSSTTAGATFAWVASNGGNIVSGANTATPTVNAAGTYTLTVTDPTNGCTATDVALVSLNNTPPNANAGLDKVLTCTTTSIALSGSSTTAGATFAWVASNGGNIVSGANTATPTVNAAGTYTLTVTNPTNGCTATDVALVTLNNTPPNANAGIDKVLTCAITSIALSGSSSTAGATFAWVASNGGNIVSGANTATPTVNAAGTYTLTVTDPVNGCTATDVALVTLNNTPPNANAGLDKVLTCSVTSIALSGSSSTAGATFAWVASNGGNIVSGANTATPTVNAAGTYTLTVTNPTNGCTATDVALVTLDANTPNANAGLDKVLTCTVTSIALSGSSTTAGATFAWVASNGGNIVSGANTATPTVNAAGTYTLTVTNPANGCTATDVALVSLNNTPPNANAGLDKVLTCTVTSIALSGSSTTAGATFAWVASNGGNIVSGANTATPTVNAAGTYTLTVTNPTNGCTATDVALVTLNNTAPNANAGLDKVLTCTVTSIALSGSSTTSGATFAWVASNGGNIVSGANTATPTVNAAGTYTLTVTDPVNGCTATDVALVSLNNTPPNANAGLDKVLNCTVSSIALSGSSTTAGATFAWVASNGGNIVSGANTATPTVNAAGTYTLTVTNPTNGCTATDVALVSLNNTPPNVSAGPDKTFCTGGSVILSGSSTTAGVTYAWVSSNGGNIVSGANTATPTVNAAGTYTLTVTNPANGCSASDATDVIVNTVTAGSVAGDQQFCFSDPNSGPVPFTSVTAGTAAGTLSYQWLISRTGCNGPWDAITGATGATFNSFVIPFTQNVSYKRVAISSLLGVVCTDTSNCVSILSGPCGGPLPAQCTYTQGYYGNKNGNSCDGNTTYQNPIDLIKFLLGVTTNPVALNPITVGRNGRSVTIPASAAGAIKLNSILPGGRTPAKLLSGNCDITTSCINAYLTQQGRINNVFLSQTIVLTLNSRMGSGGLAGFPIEQGWLVTQEQNGCGAGATPVECVDDSSTIKSTQLNQTVVNYLTNNGTAPASVTDLLNLANDLLGGTLTPGQPGAHGNIVPSYADVNSVVDAFNNVFDGCRIPWGYFDCPKSCADLFLGCPVLAIRGLNPITHITPTFTNDATRVAPADNIKVNVFPNPFSDLMNLRIKAPVSGIATIEIYNSNGTRVFATTKYVSANIETSVNYKAPVSAGTLHYKVQVGSYNANGIAVKLN